MQTHRHRPGGLPRCQPVGVASRRKRAPRGVAVGDKRAASVEHRSRAGIRVPHIHDIMRAPLRRGTVASRLQRRVLRLRTSCHRERRQLTLIAPCSHAASRRARRRRAGSRRRPAVARLRGARWWAAERAAQCCSLRSTVRLHSSYVHAQRRHARGGARSRHARTAAWGALWPAVGCSSADPRPRCAFILAVSANQLHAHLIPVATDARRRRRWLPLRGSSHGGCSVRVRRVLKHRVQSSARGRLHGCPGGRRRALQRAQAGLARRRRRRPRGPGRVRGRGRATSRARVAAQRRSRGAAAARRRAMAARRRRGHVA